MPTSPQLWTRFFTALAERGNVSDASRAAGLPPEVAYARLVAAQAPGAGRRATAWLARFTAAKEAAFDRLESAAFARAHDGVEEPIIRGSAKEGYATVGHVRIYSDGLLQFLLKSYRPQVFRDCSTTEHSGPGGRPIQTESRLIILPPINPDDPE
jgi:hypothetical protein